MAIDRSAVWRVCRWRLRQAAHQLGLTGMVGLALGAGALLFLLCVVIPTMKSAAELKALAHELRAQAATRARQQPDLPVTPAQQLTHFYGTFPDNGALPDALERVFATAQSLNLRMAEGQYELKRDSGQRLGRYEVSVPAKGDYERIRKFTSRMLADVPHASLDSIVLQRDKPNQTEIEARLRFTVFFVDR